MNGIVRNSAFPVNSLGKLRVRLYRGGLALLSVLCLLIVPTAANAACGRYGMPALKTSIKLPAAAIADSHLPGPWEIPTVVGLWHVIYTNGADQSTFNDTFDTWHIDGTEFESAFLAPAGGDVCRSVEAAGREERQAPSHRMALRSSQPYWHCNQLLHPR